MPIRSHKLPVALALVALSAPLAAQDSLLVGPRYFGGTRLRTTGWDHDRDSSSFLEVTPDSIFTPSVSATGDLFTPESPLSQAVRFFELAWLPLRGAGAMIDDDAATAYAPGDHNHPVDRPFVIDLGAAHGVRRLRLHPRLDRAHQSLFLQEFVLSTAPLIVGPWERLLAFTRDRPNVEPVVDHDFPSRVVRYLRVEPTTDRPWEIAEVEVFADGTVPRGLFVSRVFPVGRALDEPGAAAVILGRVRYEGGPISSAPVFVQTRTGTTDSPRVYYERLVEGSDDPADLAELPRADWLELPAESRGPILDSPAWSPWENVANDLVRSPGLRRFLQLRILFPLPGTSLRNLVLEYSQPPLFHQLPAEIAPDVVQPAEETAFTLSAVAFLDTADARFPDTGFRILDVTTAARVVRVDEVLVDDLPVPFRQRTVAGRGFSVDLLRPVQADGTFLQVRFRAVLFRDFTRFDVSARESAFTDPRYQTGHAAEVDAEAGSGQLVVRFAAGADRSPLAAVAPAAPVLTPNGDGVNDTFRLRFTLLHLLTAAAVTLDVHDLAGRRVAAGVPRDLAAGQHTVAWDGRTGDGAPVPPGLYLYRLTVATASGDVSRHGLLPVAY